MAGKPKVDYNKVIEFLKQGLGDTEIAKKHYKEIWASDRIQPQPVTRQTIGNVRKQATAEGKLPMDLDKKPTTSHKVTVVDKRRETLLNLDRDTIHEIGLYPWMAALDRPQLEDKINRLTNQLAAANMRIKQLEETVEDYSKADLRIKAAKDMVIHGE